MRLMSNKKLLREYQSELLLITACILFFIVRLYLATLSAYPFFQGWNEGHYSLIAKGYFEHSLLVQERGGNINWAVPPFYSWLVFAFFKLFGISDTSARLTSLFATIFALPFIYLLAKELFDQKVAMLSSLIFLFIPWVLHLSGRVQTDMLMTALMTASIACFVYAYNHQSSFILSGVFFGLALFTKQPSILILVIIAVWILVGVERNQKVTIVKKSLFPLFVGLIPLSAYILYWVAGGQEASGILRLVYGEAVHRMVPFSDLQNTLGGLLVGISPLVLLFALYELYKSRDLRNILVIWLAIYGAFVLARTPPSHEYYILPLAVPFAILASKGIFSFKDVFASEQRSRKRLGILVAILVILSTIPVSYLFLSYTGDLGYTSTKDVADYLCDYMNKNPDETYLMVLHGRYAPQLIWYMNLTEKQIGHVGNDLASVSVEDVKSIIEKSNATRIYLVIDGRGGLEERLEGASYDRVYASYYWTKLPSLFSEIYTGEESKHEYFEQHLSVYKLK